MSKRTKKNRSNRSTLKLEALEQRQLLASIVGSGTEVDTDVTLADGKVYDQVMMEGSSITVTADAGQITRVDFLDASGDIVRAEISGAGTLTIDLADFKAAAAPTEYKSDVEYVQGLATFTITGSDASTNFNVHSLGTLNVFMNEDNPIFDGGNKDGGDNLANVAALIIQGNPASPVGNSFGSIFAGNAVFGAESGAVGIIAPNVQFTGTITIGDIDAAETATPVLQLGQFSDTTTVTVAGGDLKSTNKAQLTTTNVDKLISSTGTNSNAEQLETQIIAAGSTDIAAADISYTSSAETLTIDDTWEQADLDELKTKYLNDVVIEGGLGAGLVLAARGFGDITVKGDLAGLITTDVIEKGEGKADAGELGIGDVTIEGDIVAGGAIESAAWIGDVVVNGNLDFTADDDSLDDFKWGKWGSDDKTLAAAVISTIGGDSLSSAIGNITFGVADDDETGAVDVAGVMALVQSGVAKADADNGAGIGNISALSITSSKADAIKAFNAGNIGSITTEEGLSLNNVTSAGSIGAITGATVTVGNLAAAKAVGAIESEGALTTGSITATDGTIGTITSGGATTLGALSASKAVGAITAGGNTTITSVAGTSTGAISVEGTLTVGAITASDGNVGALSSDGAMTLNGLISGDSVGAISAAKAAAGNLAINDSIVATDGTIGAITLTKAGNLALGAGNMVWATESIGNITVADGKLTFGDADSKFLAAVVDLGDDDAFGGAGGDADTYDFEGTSIGNVSVQGDIGIVGVANSIEFQANQIGDVTVKGTNAGAILTDVIFSAKGNDEDTVGTASIGNIELENSDSAGSIADGGVSTTALTGTGFSSSGDIGDITITTVKTGKLLQDAAASLFFIAGSSEMGLAVNAFADGAANKGGVSIGDVTITTNLTAALQDANGTTGAGLVIASGVEAIAAGEFVNYDVPGDGTKLDVAADLGGSIGAVVLNDLSGNITYQGFDGGEMEETGDDNALEAASVIVADEIASIRVNKGTNLLNLSGDDAPTGIALQGVLGVGYANDDTQEWATATTSNLFVVVL